MRNFKSLGRRSLLCHSRHWPSSTQACWATTSLNDYRWKEPDILSHSSPWGMRPSTIHWSISLSSALKRIELPLGFLPQPQGGQQSPKSPSTMTRGAIRVEESMGTRVFPE